MFYITPEVVLLLQIVVIEPRALAARIPPAHLVSLENAGDDIRAVAIGVE